MPILGHFADYDTALQMPPLQLYIIEINRTQCLYFKNVNADTPSEFAGTKFN